ncbi:hypothetical protein GLYMA_16G086050v4 [Glycine max]|nr:hypothetical protein GLYMA_16G086050v4 [Glycine max]KAH1150543.1 hypothetical protein GYH30_044517 [Glycine max]
MELPWLIFILPRVKFLKTKFFYWWHKQITLRHQQAS